MCIRRLGLIALFFLSVGSAAAQLPIKPGGTRSAVLLGTDATMPDGRHFHAYVLEVSPGQRLRISVPFSEFAVQLRLGTKLGGMPLWFTSPVGRQIEVVIKERAGGTLLQVTSAQPGLTGKYTLAVVAMADTGAPRAQISSGLRAQLGNLMDRAAAPEPASTAGLPPLDTVLARLRDGIGGSGAIEHRIPEGAVEKDVTGLRIERIAQPTFQGCALSIQTVTEAHRRLFRSNDFLPDPGNDEEWDYTVDLADLNPASIGFAQADQKSEKWQGVAVGGTTRGGRRAVRRYSPQGTGVDSISELRLEMLHYPARAKEIATSLKQAALLCARGSPTRLDVEQKYRAEVEAAKRKTAASLAEYERKDASRRSLLAAVRARDTAGIRVALEGGAERSDVARDWEGMVAAMRNDRIDEIRIRLEYGGRPAWLEAAKGGHLAALKVFYEYASRLGPNDRAPTDGRLVTLSAVSHDVLPKTGPVGAAGAGQLAVLKYLIAQGHEVNFADSYKGETPLMAAAASGRAEAIRLLLQAGANPNARSKRTLYPYGTYSGKGARTALELAILGGFVEAAEALRAGGARD